MTKQSPLESVPWTGFQRNHFPNCTLPGYHPYHKWNLGTQLKHLRSGRVLHHSVHQIRFCIRFYQLHPSRQIQPCVGKELNERWVFGATIWPMKTHILLWKSVIISDSEVFPCPSMNLRKWTVSWILEASATSCCIVIGTVPFSYFIWSSHLQGNHSNGVESNRLSFNFVLTCVG